MAFATQAANKLLNKILKGTDFTTPTGMTISLHTAEPGDSGTSEVSGGSYARKTPTIGTVASKAATTTADLAWASMPACTVTHAALRDSGGTVWMWGALTASKVVAAGATFTLAAGDCDFTLT